MKNILPVCIASLVAAVASPVFGQAPTAGATPPALPPGPLIQKSAPAFSEWVVTLKYASSGPSGAAASGAPGPSGGPGAEQSSLNKTTMITKTGDTRREVVVAADGSRTSIYYSHEMLIRLEPGSRIPLLQIAQDVRTAEDFHGFGWLSEGNFSNIIRVQDRDCLVFKGEANIGEQAVWQGKNAMSSAKVSAVAVIDAETRMPLSLKIGDETHTYRFNSPPSTPIAFPPEVQAAIEERNKRVKVETIAPPRP